MATQYGCTAFQFQNTPRLYALATPPVDGTLPPPLFSKDKPSPSECKGMLGKRVLLFFGGLGDKFLGNRYHPALAHQLAKHWQCRMITLMMRSSGAGYGIRTLNGDVIDISYFLRYLVGYDLCEEVILMGYSTGTQDIVAIIQYLRNKILTSKDEKEKKEHQSMLGLVRACIFQAPVSDRDYLLSQREAESMHSTAKNAVKNGDGDELMPRRVDPWAAMTAERYLSMTTRNAPEDPWSRDLLVTERQAYLTGFHDIPSLLVFSGQDVFCPAITLTNSPSCTGACSATPTDPSSQQQDDRKPCACPFGTERRAEFICEWGEVVKMCPSKGHKILDITAKYLLDPKGSYLPQLTSGGEAKSFSGTGEENQKGKDGGNVGCEGCVKNDSDTQNTSDSDTEGKETSSSTSSYFASVSRDKPDVVIWRDKFSHEQVAPICRSIATQILRCFPNPGVARAIFLPGANHFVHRPVDVDNIVKVVHVFLAQVFGVDVDVSKHQLEVRTDQW